MRRIAQLALAAALTAVACSEGSTTSGSTRTGAGGDTAASGGYAGSTYGSGGTPYGSGGSTYGSGGSTYGSGGTPYATGGSTYGSGGVGGSGGSSGSGGFDIYGGYGDSGTVANDASAGGTAGSGGTTGAGGTTGTGGTAGTGGTGGSGGATGVDAGPQPNSLPGYGNLAPAMLSPLDPNGDTALSPAAPTGWKWYPTDGTQCRDGSQAGMFVHFTLSDKLYIYMEGGGACANLGFCNYNPRNVNEALSGTGETVIGSTLGVVPARQQPGVYENGVLNGLFDTSNAANPFKDWNGVYIPYCSGDVHFGTRTNVTVPNLATPQQFVGAYNMQKFVGHIVPTFPNVSRVVLTGASAGSFGAGLNFSMVQDAFGTIPVDLIMDSGFPFKDAYMPACMQQHWRERWGLNAAMPADCSGCFNADGGGMLNLADYIFAKHPNAHIAAVSSMEDEVMRLFFSMGLNNCASIETSDPVLITTGQLLPSTYYAAADYRAGVLDVKSTYLGTGRIATYALDALLQRNLHQHLMRARFYDTTAGTETIAAYVTAFLGGSMHQIGP